MNDFSALRTKVSLTDSELSEFLGIPITKIVAYASGQTRPSSREIRILEGLSLATRRFEVPQSSSTQRDIQSQLSFSGMCQVEAAVEQLARAGIEERGAIFTKREVVDFILDLVGYRANCPLYEFRLLEPSFGDGDFLFPALDRLFFAYNSAGQPKTPVAALRNAICAVELHKETYNRTLAALLVYLAKQGLNKSDCHELATTWLRQGDFLLTELSPAFTQIVGNPPYVRQELIPDALMAEYRRRYKTIFDRADVYVPFIERALQLLAPNAALGLICADRWTKNRYGGPLRRLIAEKFRLRAYVDMVDTPAFHSEVMAYPAIFVIGNEGPGPTRLAYRPLVDATTLGKLARAIGADELGEEGPIRESNEVARGAEPWVLESPDQLTIVRRLEQSFPLIEDAGCKIGIGVATGADRVFVAPFDKLDVEEDRKLPLVMSRDILSGVVKWGGKGVLNPFADDGSLVNLSDYPRLGRYLNTHGAEIQNRHVARKNPAGWYRTIDRIYPALTSRPKLLIPDIKGDAHIVFEEGKLYPHHNLYFITSDSWDLLALQAVLLSGIAKLFVSIYSTKMRGGYLRFQAQYLRRIRIPKWADVPDALKTQLVAAARHADKKACDTVVFQLYGLSEKERHALSGSRD